MSLFKREAAVEVTAASGVLRVTIHPRARLIPLAVEAVLLVLIAVYVSRGWAAMSVWSRSLALWVIGGGVLAWFYQLSGSEIIEFDAQKLTISKEILGWKRTSEYQVTDCSELEWREQSRHDYYGLQCKVGWRRVKFAQYISESEAIEILTALQTHLPDVAQKMGVMPRSSKHFTTLDLS